MRSAELTLPGFATTSARRSIRSALASPFFRRARARRRLGRSRRRRVAHPLDDGTAVAARARRRRRRRPALGAGRRARTGGWSGRSSRRWRAVEPLLLGPFPLAAARRCGSRASSAPGRRSRAARARSSADALARRASRRERARAFFAGNAAHSMLPLERRPSAGVRARAADARPRGRLAVSARRRRRRSPTRSRRGSRELGGEIASPSSRSTSCRGADVVLADVSPRELLRLAGRLPGALRARAAPLPPRAGRVQARLGARRARSRGGAERCARAATVHLGGTLDEIAASERRAVATAARPSGRSCCSRSRASSTRRARRRASTRRGRTATSRTARTGT